MVYRINQLDHELNITVRRQPGDTFEKIFGKSRTTDMLLSSRTILLFMARRYDQIRKVLSGGTLSEDLSRIGGGIPKNKMNTREKTRGTLKNKSNHTSTRPTITQDPQGT